MAESRATTFTGKRLFDFAMRPEAEVQVGTKRPLATLAAQTQSVACRGNWVSQPRTQNRIKLKLNSIFHPSAVKMSHASMLKASRQHQKTKKRLHVAAKQAKRLAKQALAGPAVKREKVKKVKPTKEELGRQDAKKSGADTGKKGAS